MTNIIVNKPTWHQSHELEPQEQVMILFALCILHLSCRSYYLSAFRPYTANPLPQTMCNWSVKYTWSKLVENIANSFYISNLSSNSKSCFILQIHSLELFDLHCNWTQSNRWTALHEQALNEWSNHVIFIISANSAIQLAVIFAYL